MYRNLNKVIRMLCCVFFTVCNISTLSAQCGNIDFEAGNFTGWSAYTGCIDPNISINGTGVVNGRHTIMTGTGVDPLISAIPVVSPYGGTTSVRLGNSAAGKGVDRLSYTFTVDPSSPMFTYQYAVIFQDPSHTASQQPRFEVQVRSQNGTIIPCGQYQVTASANLPGFQNGGTHLGDAGSLANGCTSASGSSDVVRYRNWSLVAMDLTAYIGTQVTIEFTTTDCTQGGHFGYAYIDASCGPLSITGRYCPGDLTATLSAPAGFQSYLWSTGATTQSITVNNPEQMQGTSMSVVCTPFQGGAACATTLSYVFELSPNVEAEFDVHTACGLNDASFVDASFLGTGTIDSWSWWVDGSYAGNSSVLNYTFPTPGDYEITLTTNSASGCPDTITKVVYVPPGLSAIAATPSGYGVSCFGANDGYATVKVLTGNPPYNYSWNNGAYTTDSIYGLGVGEYTIEVTDSTGCVFNDTLTISGPSQIVVNPTTEGICYGFTDGKIWLNPSGGDPPYNFRWSHNPSLNADSATGLLAGVYSFTITDSRNCQFDSTIDITPPTTPFVVVATHTNTSCFGGNDGSASVASVTGSTPGYTYAWSTNPSQTTNVADNLIAGTYACTITDANGCTTSVSQTVSQPSQIIINATKTDVRCFGDSTGALFASVTGGTPGYIYSWSSGESTSSVADVPAGTYVLTVTDNNLCSAAATVTVTEPAPLSVAISSFDERCFGGTTAQARAIPSGGTTPYSFVWSTSPTQHSATATNLAAGTYTVSLTDANSCSASATTTINEPSLLTASISNVVHNICFDGQSGSATVNAAGGTPAYSFQWSSVPVQNSATASQLRAGTYTVTVTDDSLCTATATVLINEPPSMQFSYSTTPTTCYDSAYGALRISVSAGAGNYTYAWSPNVSNTDSAINILSGNYSVTITDADGCSIVRALEVGTPPQLVLTPYITTPSCNGFQDGAINVSAAGGTPSYVYSLWQNGVMLSSGNNGTFSNLFAGTYMVQFVDNNNCTINRPVTVSEPAVLAMAIITDSVNCFGYDDGRITLSATGGTPPYSYNVGGQSQTGTGVFSNLSPGQYGLHVQDSKGCYVDSSTTVYQPAPLMVIPNPDSLVAYLGETKPITLSSNYGSVQYQWQPVTGLDCSTCEAVNVYALNSGYYIVIATTRPNDLDCETQIRVPLTVIPDYSVYIPTAFSPNNSGANDYYEIFGKKESWAEMKFQVFNRWGELVFESSDPHFKWDGTYKGALQPSMVYLYTMSLKFIDGHKLPLKMGSITLIR